jgi:hypothetical protein
VPDAHGGAVMTFTLRALDQSEALIEGQSANWTIAGSAELMDRVGSSARVTLHGADPSVLTASVGDAEATIVIESSGVLTSPTR